MKYDFKIKIFADGAEADKMKAQYKDGIVSGFTTNPSLIKKAGVKDYKAFAKNIVENIPDLPISFEVFADDLNTMEKEAKVISGLGKNVFVKIPSMTTKYESTVPLVKKLTDDGIKVNITTVMTDSQVESFIKNVNPNTPCFLSIFAGRIADTGADPMPIVKKAVDMSRDNKNLMVLWASTREFYNIIEAEKLGVDAITVPDSVLAKFKNYGRDLNELSHDAVIAFSNDIKSLNMSIL
ncbi:MAG: transaldolase [Clostridia bacterium]|jgi:transaldolase|nr:transaldolase [Clostridia bacterium]MCI2000016.1 transaldolase [Clostridia bacterium]MCI2014450.1 transaldolase [Clostridia bacterium]